MTFRELVLVVTALLPGAGIAGAELPSGRGDDPDRPRDSEIEEGYLDVNGTTLFYKALGSGEPIVAVHGGPGFDHRQFLPYIWELAAGHRVIVYDQRGTGLSSGSVDAESIHIDTFVADLDGLRAALGIDRMNLLGHSWGGILAMYYGIRHAERLRSLVLCSTAASHESFAEMRETYQAARSAEDTNRLAEIQASDAYRHREPATVERFWRVFFRPYFPDPERVAGLDLTFTENTLRNGPAIAGYLLRSTGEFDLHDDLKAIVSPVLVLHGDSDPMPLKYAERIHRSIAGSELVIVPDAGHWLFVDGTEVFRRSVLDFLERVDHGTKPPPAHP